jgi:GNAT superfamily N-acetyltransferase
MREIGATVIRPVVAGEDEALRELRLRALAEAPEAFVSDVADESAREPAHWRGLIDDPEQGTVLVAQATDGRLTGMAGGRWFDRERGTAQLWGLWVDPTLRGSGLGAALVTGIGEWAARLGAGFVRLGVLDSDGNRAEAFYHRLGFVALDEPAPLRTDPSRLVTFMVRPV